MLLQGMPIRLLLIISLFLTLLGLQTSAFSATCTIAKEKLTPCSEDILPAGDQFLLAVSRSQLHKAKQLLSRGGVPVDYRSSNRYVIDKTRVRADIDSPFMSGNKRSQFASGTAFDVALSQYNSTMVNWLLSRGASPDAGYFANLINRTSFSSHYPNRYLQLPFAQRAKIISVGYVMELAARRNQVSAVQKLLTIEPRAIHYRGNIILSRAIQQGKWKITHLILNQGADVHALNNFSGLFESIIRSEPTHYNLLQKLLRHAKQRKKFNYDPLVDKALAKKDERALRLLVSSGANLNPKRGEPALYKALDAGNLNMAKVLFSLGAKANHHYRSESLLSRAIRHEKLGFVKLLLAHHAKANEPRRPGSSNLELAMSKKDLRYSQLLIKAGANVNLVKSGTTPLIRAVEQVRPKLVQLLVNSGAKLKLTNYTQETALHIATRKADRQLMQILLKAGANPNARNSSHQTPLLIAIHKKNIALIQTLLPYKTNINLANNAGQTPLHSAVLLQNLPIVRLLLSKGAIPNTNSRYGGTTPLLDALSWRRPQIARLLINKGARVNVVNNARESALDIANKRGLRALARLIKQKGGLTAAQLGANPEHVRVRPIRSQ
ncbi:MAG: ankyrin repeat domain-containing protein [Cocleimonas sp.]|nr:ankyrin repeat domain-containing protein [Cocleimonas sp.]